MTTEKYDNAPEWKKKLANELQKPMRKKFLRRSVYSPGVDNTWTADLAFFDKLASVNKGYKYILVVIDIFSRFAWCKALKDKTGKEVCRAFKEIFDTGVKPKKIWTDSGGEFYNKTVENLFKTNDITLYSTSNEVKATIAERFVRTLREKIEKSYILTDSTVWINVLPKLVSEYNNEKHRHLRGMTPTQARIPQNKKRVYRAQFNNTTPEETISPLFLKGDKVRVSILKKLFDKGARPKWSEEVFTIKDYFPSSRMMYKLEDLSGEVVDGTFYAEQLQRTDQEIFRIERILRKRTKNGIKQARVKWAAYDKKFNSWIPETDIYKSMQ